MAHALLDLGADPSAVDNSGCDVLQHLGCPGEGKRILSSGLVARVRELILATKGDLNVGV